MINNLIDSIRECQIQSGVGYSFSRNSGGTTLTIKTQTRAGSGSQVQPPCPFDITATAVSSGYDVSFYIGTVNGILPTNMFAPITNVTTDQITYFYLKCSSDGKLITEAVIESDTALRNPQNINKDVAPEEMNVLLGCLTTAGLPLKAIACENLNLKIVPSIQEDNVSYVAGERNFSQYYSWVY